jgi:hypothetical protein
MQNFLFVLAIEIEQILSLVLFFESCHDFKSV